MEEIKVGEYARIEDGIIEKMTFGRLKDIYTDEKGILRKWEGEDVWGNEYSSIITKHSSNIIDLIEVGDYVNGHKVVFADDCKGYMKEIYCEDDKNFGIWEEMITSIVTKEQFANIEYKVED